jgi:alpha-glucuronidase
LYAFGRLSCDYTLSSEKIANEWIGMTLTNEIKAKVQINEIMQKSLPTYISYTYPLGLHHMMGEGHHYGPEPWLTKAARPDWTSIYYHRADSTGLGFDRTGKLSNAIKLYSKEITEIWGNAEKCDLNYLLWFHHIAWNKKLSTGNTLWEELCYRYYNGVIEVEKLQNRDSPFQANLKARSAP